MTSTHPVTSQLWASHLRLRLSQAQSITLISQSAHIDLSSMRVVTPAGMSEDRLEAENPDRSLGSTISSARPTRGEWLARPDLFDVVSITLLELYSREYDRIYAEPGYAKRGDPAADNAQHVVHGDLVWGFVDLALVSPDHLASRLRKWRSNRLLAVMAPHGVFPAGGFSSGLFVVDAFDGDSACFARLSN